MKVTHRLGPRRGMPVCGAAVFDHVTELEQLITCEPCKGAGPVRTHTPARVPVAPAPLPEVERAVPVPVPVVKAAPEPPAPVAAPVAKDPPKRLEATKPVAPKPKAKPKQRVTQGARGSRS